MRNWLLITWVVSMTTMGCISEKENKIELSDLNLYLETDLEIDSVFLSNIGQDREFHFLKYSDTITIDFNDSINDLYNIFFYTKDKVIQNQLWLNGENIIINGKITDKLKIDTLIGSDLYYKSIDFRNQYEKLIIKKVNDSIINTFLLTELDKNITNPLSLEIADNFLYKNMSKSNELKKLYSLLSIQDEVMKNHFISPYKEIEKILNANKIGFSDFKFINTENKLVDLSLSKDKKYLIDFWFIGCAPCIKDHKQLSKKLEQLKSKDIELIGISIDKKQEEWVVFLKDKKYNWLNLREVDDYKKRMTTNLLVGVFPTYILTDSKGTIIQRTLSLPEILNDLDIK